MSKIKFIWKTIKSILTLIFCFCLVINSFTGGRIELSIFLLLSMATIILDDITDDIKQIKTELKKKEVKSE